MYDCKVESHESTRQRAASSQSKNHDDHIASKRFTSMTHYNLVHKFIPMPQAVKIPDAKAAVDKGIWKKSRARIKLFWKQKKIESPLCYIVGHMSPQKCGVRTQITEVQRQNRAPGGHCKKRL